MVFISGQKIETIVFCLLWNFCPIARHGAFCLWRSPHCWPGCLLQKWCSSTLENAWSCSDSGQLKTWDSHRLFEQPLLWASSVCEVSVEQLPSLSILCQTSSTLCDPRLQTGYSGQAVRQTMHTLGRPEDYITLGGKEHCCSLYLSSASQRKETGSFF